MRMSRAEAEFIAKNRCQLRTIIMCVIFLRRQGLTFRGYREDGEHLNDLNNNPGNFKALLKLLEDTETRHKKDSMECNIHTKHNL